MNCKSCDTEINPSAHYCNNCGAKIVEGRLSLVGTWHEFVGPFFSWDNNFWKTITHLTTQPDTVLRAYISGARNKYFKPFPFIILYATIGLLFYKVFGINQVNQDFMQVQMGDSPGMELGAKINKLITTYYNFFTIGMIPFYAFMSWRAFPRKQINFSEHLVIQCYIQGYIGFFMILSNLFFITLLNSPELNLWFSFMVYLAYANYAFSEFFKYPTKRMVIANLKFFGWLLLIYLLILILGVISAALMGWTPPPPPNAG